MNTSELHEAFRTDVGVESTSILSDDEVFRYMNDAYRNFVRLTGGIPDFTTASVCQVPIVAGVQTAPLDKSILKIVRVTRASDNGLVQVINAPDLGHLYRDDDYGSILQLNIDNQPGEVKYMMIGAQQNLARWVQIPLVNDTANLIVFRLPLVDITGEGQPLTDVAEQHHLALLSWMKALAFRKSDPALYNPRMGQQYAQEFTSYCGMAKAEVDQYKHKIRVVRYGGI